MSKIVTFEQSKRLQALGISIVSDCGYVGYTKSGELVSRRKFKEDRDYQLIPSWIRVFTVSEGLDWIREEKGIPCSVHLEFEENNKEWFYYGEYGIKGDNRVYDTETFDTHSLASSALLDAVLNYLEERTDV